MENQFTRLNSQIPGTKTTPNSYNDKPKRCVDSRTFCFKHHKCSLTPYIGLTEVGLEGLATG